MKNAPLIRHAAKFLTGGGEMGELARSFDWSATALGNPADWPASLKVIVRLALSSPQPMFIWWGDELTQFYNDAYRQILGQQGKHPAALGQKGNECWADIGDIIFPLIKKVFKGENVISENQMLPLFRNNKMEEVFWDFGFSPLYDDDEKVTGVLVICAETTKQVYTQRQLVKQVNNLLVKAPVAICTLTGRDHVIESVNESMLALWGRKKEQEVIGLPVFDALPEFADQGVKELMDHVLDTGEPYLSGEMPLNLLRNGKLQPGYIKFTYQPLITEGVIEGIISVAYEITEQVLSRKKIAYNEVKARIAIASANLGTYEINLLTDEISGNRRFYKICGLPYGASRKDIAELIHPDDLKVRDAAIQQGCVTGKSECEIRYIHKDNSYHWVKIHGRILFNEQKQPIRILGVVAEITEQKNSEKQKSDLLIQQVKEGQRLKLFESVINHITESVIITAINNASGGFYKIIYCNKAFTAMTGYSKEDTIGKGLKMLYGPKTNKHEIKRLEIALKKLESCEIEVINYKKNGEEFWNNICIAPVAAITGNYTHWIIIERDVTLRRKQDQDLTKAIIKTQENERFNIGAELHDNVNQILAGALLNLSMTKGKLDGDVKKYVNNAVTYLRTVIDEIRKVSHWLAPVGLDGNTIEATFKSLLDSNNIDSQYEIEFTCSPRGLTTIPSDIQLNLYRILQEQISNIRKYAGASLIKIRLGVLGNAIYLSISDNGVGFDTTLFSAGIGLSNIKKRAELFSGSFLLQSSKGNGCEVNVLIPIS